MAKVHTTVTVSVRLQLPSGWSQKDTLNFVSTAMKVEQKARPDTCPELISCKITNKETSYG